MTTIGAGWKKKDKNGNSYISFAVDKPLLPLVLDESKMLAAYPVKEKKNDNSPDFRLDLFIPTKKTENQETETENDIWD